tara:strand:- start:152 stop:1411 length:1260 start_codon:yes stop_codon:yes gene_type:complete
MFQKLVKVHTPHEVTTIASDEVDPVSLGISPKDLKAIWNSVISLYQTGLHPSIALCIRRHGKILMDRTIGHSHGNGPEDYRQQDGKEVATPDTLYNLFSASKAITAMLIHLLDERGKLHLDDAISDYIPDFAKAGKRHITIRHILTHRAGIPNIAIDSNPLDVLSDRSEVLQRICAAKPVSRPGRNLAYHAISGGFLLGEIIEELTGKSPRQFLQDEICTPLGLRQFNYGVPASEVPKVAVHSYTGPPPALPYAWLLEKSLGMDIRKAVALSNDPRFLTGIIPSGNVISTPRETTLFFELLLRQGTLNGNRIFQPRTIQRAIAEQSYMEMDSTLLLPVRYGMGFMLGGDYASFYGFKTRRAFGHLGFTNCLTYADPERDISVALLNSGKPFITTKLLRWLNVMRVIAQRIPSIKPTSNR